MKKNDQPVFDMAIRTADMLVKMFGPNCEVAVHDFSDLKKSLIHIAGNVTERTPGAPITDLVLNELAKRKSEIKDIANYKTQTKKGKILKSSTVFLRNADNKVIGALCMNYDISLMIQFGGDIEAFTSFDESDSKEETFFTSVQDVIHEMVDQVLQQFKKAPALMTLDEKVDCVRQLDDKGTFLIKGSTEYVASVLGVSKFTIYNYLQKIKTMNDDQVHEIVEQSK
ncbi:helix-turn-helix transcriptional regulator [Bacillus sp. CRN 9]|uniref:helix-turn-helix transcriptional regulator n=1 Tax=Cytobacillus horneckiae TaxID=549687 RepID=UPI002AA580DC